MEVFSNLEVIEQPVYRMFKANSGMCGQLITQMVDGYPVYEVNYFMLDANGKPVVIDDAFTIANLSVGWTPMYAVVEWENFAEDVIYDITFNRFKLAADMLDISDYYMTERQKRYEALDGRIDIDDFAIEEVIIYTGNNPKHNWFKLCT